MSNSPPTPCSLDNYNFLLFIFEYLWFQMKIYFVKKKKKPLDL